MTLPEIGSYSVIRREILYGENSKIDFLLQSPGKADCYLEVKNVHFKDGSTAFFPDTPTTRGQRHMKELANQVQKGNRAVVLYVIQREDVEAFSFGKQFDPLFAQAAQEAWEGGVEVIAYTCHINRTAITLKKSIPFLYNTLQDLQ